MERLSGVDAGFLAGETPEWHMHAGAIVVLDPPPALDASPAEALRELLRARIDLLGPFRHRLVESPFGLGRPVWIDTPDLDLEAHVRRVRAPAPGGPREVAELAGHLFASKLDRSRPLWEIWVLEGLENDQVGYLVKVHHSLVDGIRGARLYEVLFDLAPDAPLTRPDGERPTNEQPPSLLAMLAGAAGFLATTPLRAARTAGGLVPAAARLVRFLRSAAGENTTLPFQAPRTSLNRPLTARRSFAFASVSLEDMKTVKRAFGVTLNDVALALCAGALRSYLLERDELPDRPLVAQIPVGVHRDDVGSQGNFVAAIGAALPVELEDPAARLRAIHASTRSAKELRAAMGDELLMDLMDVVPPALVTAGVHLYRSLGLGERHPPIFNLIVSNLPGPPVPLYSSGARVVAAYTLGPLLVGCGLNITLMSYMDRVDFGVAACPEVVEDPWRLADALPQALAELAKVEPR